MWYHSWPDFGVPEDTGPFLDFVESVRSFKSSLETSPCLVHCSAGVGRTGTFISVNLGIEQFANTGKVDPLGYICQLRQDRGGMIQTIDQYTFVYRALHAYQERLDHRDKESKDKLLIRYGPPELLEDNPFLPPHIALPLVEDLAGSGVPEGFMTQLTQTIRPVPRYSDSVSSVSNSVHSVKSSCDSLTRGSSGDDSSPKSAPSKPLLSKPNTNKESKRSQKESKRRSKVKSLFFPLSLSPKDKQQSNQDLRHLEASQRSLSLNNVKFTNSSSNSPRVSLSLSQKSGDVMVTSQRSVVSSKSGHTDPGSTNGDKV